MKIIDAHMHFYKVEGFDKIAKIAGHENSAEHYLKACKENNVVMSIAMGNARTEEPHFGGTVPRVPDLAGTFNFAEYNQPKEIAYCAGVDSDKLNPGNADKTAQEFERYVRKPECVGLKIYLGYNQVYAYDPVHFPLYELAQQYDIPVAFHTGDLANGHGQLKYAQPLTIDDVAVRFPKVRFVICHCGNPWIKEAVEVASKNENVYVDMSGLLEGQFDATEFYEKHQSYFNYMRMWLDYIERYDKFMYGTDWPLVNIKSYIDIMKLVMPEEHHEKFFYDNALRVYSKLKKLVPQEEK